MDTQKIDASKITKPIQLLAAWLIGLIIVNGSFLAAAAKLSTPTWAPTLLVIACVMNVPLFLICIFLLQTKFRPEMQEDRYYSEYLSKQIESIGYGYLFVDSISDDFKRLQEKNTKERRKELAKKWALFRKEKGKMFDPRTNKDVVDYTTRVLGGEENE